MDSITIDYAKALRQAAKLDECADKLKRMSSGDYANAMQQLSAEWRSESASTFFGKGQQLRGNINNTARDLETIAGNIRRAARRIYEADQRAAEIARQRSSRE